MRLRPQRVIVVEEDDARGRHDGHRPRAPTQESEARSRPRLPAATLHLRVRAALAAGDLYQSPGRANEEQILIPTLVKVRPFPQRRIIGHLPHVDMVLHGLNIIESPEAHGLGGRDHGDSYFAKALWRCAGEQSSVPIVHAKLSRAVRADKISRGGVVRSRAHRGSPPLAPDPRESAVVLIDRSGAEMEGPPDPPSDPTLPPDSSPSDPPSLPAPRLPAGGWLATLTVLTGEQAGQVMVVGGAPIVIGRAADADLVVEDPGVSEHHGRVTRSPSGGFSILDLASTNGTFLGANRIGVALLRGGDLLRLGPSAELRFTIIDPP